MSRKKVSKRAVVPLRHHLGENYGETDLENKPIEQKYRKLVPKSLKMIKIGHTEKLQHGLLRCHLNNELVTVSLSREGKSIGRELIYSPTKAEIKSGIPEWKFDLQSTSVLGTDWDYQSTDIWFWTIKGLRKDGKPQKTINLS